MSGVGDRRHIERHLEGRFKVARKNYPAMFVTAGFYDSQVSYAEPAKWVARLRASKTDAHDLLFKTDMDAGHGGRSGRLGSIEESAEIMGWLIAMPTTNDRPNSATDSACFRCRT